MCGGGAGEAQGVGEGEARDAREGRGGGRKDARDGGERGGDERGEGLGHREANATPGMREGSEGKESQRKDDSAVPELRHGKAESSGPREFLEDVQIGLEKLHEGDKNLPEPSAYYGVSRY